MRRPLGDIHTTGITPAHGPPSSHTPHAAMSISLRSAHLLPLLLLVLLAPTTLFYLRLATSMSSGVTVASLMIVALGLADSHLRRTLGPPLKVAALVATLLMTHLVVASAFGPIDLVRGIGSAVMLIVTIVAGHLLATQIMAASPRALQRASSRCLGLLAVIGVLAILGLLQPGDWEKPAFPFTEPSHLALAVAPFLVAAPIGSRPAARAAWLLTFVAIGAVLQNLTMIVACALAAMITLRPLQVLALLALLVPISLSQDLGYYLARLDFSQDTQNLSSLVFLQGWQLMDESLAATHFVGRGFQQLGLVDSDASATQLIYTLIQDSLNLLDGGFTLSKLVSELGAAGIALALVYLRIGWSAAQVVRTAMTSRRAAAAIPAARVFAAAILVSYLVELLVRGVGYFSSSGLLMVASLWIWHRTRPATAPGPLTRRPATPRLAGTNPRAARSMPSQRFVRQFVDGRHTR